MERMLEREVAQGDANRKGSLSSTLWGVFQLSPLRVFLHFYSHYSHYRLLCIVNQCIKTMILAMILA
jgi:hypothetical protein